MPELYGMLCLKCGGAFMASGEKEIVFCPYCGRKTVASSARADYDEKFGASESKQVSHCASVGENGSLPSENALGERADRGGDFEIDGGVLVKYYGNAASVTIPKTVREIGTGAFFGNQTLEAVVLHEGVRAILNAAFDGCESLQNVNLTAAGLKKISSLAFKDCKSLRSVEIGGGVRTVGDDAFSGCSALEAAVFHDGVRIIGARAFYGCKSLRRAEFPDSLLTIGRLAFAGCVALEKIKLPSGLETLDDNAFSGCASLTEAELPVSVKTVGKAPFKDGGVRVIRISKEINAPCLKCGEKTIPVFGGRCKVCNCEYLFSDDLIDAAKIKKMRRLGKAPRKE